MKYDQAEIAAQSGKHIRRNGWNDESYAVWRNGRLHIFLGGNPTPSDCQINDLEKYALDDWIIR